MSLQVCEEANQGKKVHNKRKKRLSLQTPLCSIMESRNPKRALHNHISLPLFYKSHLQAFNLDCTTTSRLPKIQNDVPKLGNVSHSKVVNHKDITHGFSGRNTNQRSWNRITMQLLWKAAILWHLGYAVVACCPELMACKLSEVG